MISQVVSFDGKRVGFLINGCIYLSKRSAKKHLFRGGAPTPSVAINKGTAYWGISTAVLSSVPGAKVIVIEETGRKEIFWTTRAVFEAESIVLEITEQQRFLNLNRWNIVDSVERIIDVASMIASRRAA